MNQEEEKYFAANKALWNAKTPIHMASEFYDVESFRAGESTLQSIELHEVGEVRGKSMLHLQCHFGQDSLSWVRLGARVTGVDFSEAAISQAQELARELELPARFVCCNLYDLRQHLSEPFEIVFTSYGTIGWLPDLDRWAALVNHFLEPGGFFYIVDFHPVVWMLDDKFQHFAYDYFNTRPIEETTDGSYANRNVPISMATYGWNHPLSEVVTALLAQGLQIELLHEFPYSTWDSFPGLIEVEQRKWVFEHFQTQIPYLYSIKARKPV